jgi:hypothetical protein
MISSSTMIAITANNPRILSLLDPVREAERTGPVTVSSDRLTLTRAPVTAMRATFPGNPEFI